jgi:hypothetical protein
MSESTDRFYDGLRQKLERIDHRLNGLKAKAKDDAEQAEGEARTRLEAVERRIEQDREKIASARAEMNTWLVQRKFVTRDKVEGWKARRETETLESRAAEAEAYADAAAQSASAAIDEAEHAVLDAWLARRDADAAQARTP